MKQNETRRDKTRLKTRQDKHLTRVDQSICKANIPMKEYLPRSASQEKRKFPVKLRKFNQTCRKYRMMVDDLVLDNSEFGPLLRHHDYHDYQ